MTKSKAKYKLGWGFVTAVVGSATLLLTGCQVEMAGQTLPSPYFLDDDVQYYAPAPSEFKLSREAAAQKEQAEAIQSQAQDR